MKYIKQSTKLFECIIYIFFGLLLIIVDIYFDTRFLSGVFIPIMTVKITLSWEKSKHQEEECKRIRISSFNIYVNLTSKILDIKNVFRDVGDKPKKYYFPIVYNKELDNIKSLKEDIFIVSHKLKISSIQYLRAFYINYEQLHKNLSKSKGKLNNIDLERMKSFYMNHIYMNKDLEELLNVLRYNIVSVEKKYNLDSDFNYYHPNLTMSINEN